ncbi:MAG: hypothetical protein JJU36_13120 [Phycisphaeraceae bacterium]|nr:hypothetical protein [Phycisphaeraceae bacterium]
MGCGLSCRVFFSLTFSQGVSNMKAPFFLALAAMLLACATATHAQTYTLLEGGGSASIQLQTTSAYPDPTYFPAPGFIDVDSFVLAPPSVGLGAVGGSASVSHVFHNITFGNPDFTIFPWASASLDLSGQDCGTLDINMSVSLNLGTVEGGVVQPGIQPTVQFLMDNDVPSFSGSVSANVNFLVQLFTGDCEICLPAGIFEVDFLDGNGFVPFDGCLPDNVVCNVRAAGYLDGEMSLGMSFSWNRPTQQLVITNGIPFDELETTIFPEPTSAMITLICVGGLLSRRRR